MSSVGIKKVASLDIGDGKIVCVIGFFDTNNKLCVNGVGVSKTLGLKYGQILDQKKFEDSLISAITMAQAMSNFMIEDIIININASLFYSINTEITVNLNKKKISDLNIIIESIKNYFKKKEERVIHISLLKSKLDDTETNDFYNTSADTLKQNFYLIVLEDKKIKSIEKTIYNNILGNIFTFVSNGFANSYSLLDDNDRTNGAIIIDIGFFSTTVSIIHNNKYIYENSINIGADTITKDIANTLNIDYNISEKIKNDNSNLFFTTNNIDEPIKILKDSNFIDNKLLYDIKIVQVANIIKDRLKELSDIIISDIVNKNFLHLNISNVVLSGKTSNMEGISSFFENCLKLKVHIGLNENNYTSINDYLFLELKKNLYSVAIGNLLYLSKNFSTTDNKPSLLKSLKEFLFKK